jgi:cation transport protein ChaC
MRPLWVFAYGSLMWQPGFEPAERRPALLRGLHRSFCVVSHVHRGTRERPGLVAGLDRGGACRGIAFRVRDGEEAIVLDYLRTREQPTMVYRETTRPIELIGEVPAVRRRAVAVCFAVDRRHEQYAGPLAFDVRVRLVLTGVGRSGRSIDYLDEMVACLAGLGINDGGLAALAAAVRRNGEELAGPGAAGPPDRDVRR